MKTRDFVIISATLNAECSDHWHIFVLFTVTTEIWLVTFHDWTLIPNHPLSHSPSCCIFPHHNCFRNQRVGVGIKVNVTDQRKPYWLSYTDYRQRTRLVRLAGSWTDWGTIPFIKLCACISWFPSRLLKDWYMLAFISCRREGHWYLIVGPKISLEFCKNRKQVTFAA